MLQSQILKYVEFTSEDSIRASYSDLREGLESANPNVVEQSLGKVV